MFSKHIVSGCCFDYYYYYEVKETVSNWKTNRESTVEDNERTKKKTFVKECLNFSSLRILLKDSLFHFRIGYSNEWAKYSCYMLCICTTMCVGVSVCSVRLNIIWRMKGNKNEERIIYIIAFYICSIVYV